MRIAHLDSGVPSTGLPLNRSRLISPNLWLEGGVQKSSTLRLRAALSGVPCSLPWTRYFITTTKSHHIAGFYMLRGLTSSFSRRSFSSSIQHHLTLDLLCSAKQEAEHEQGQILGGLIPKNLNGIVRCM